MREFALVSIFLFTSHGGMAQDPAPISEARQLQTVETQFTGDYEGLRSIDDESRPLAAQVVSMGGGDYRIKLAPGIYDGSKALGEITGKLKGERVRVEGTVEDVTWSGFIEGGVLRGNFGHGGTFELKRLRRESPTLGADPPEGAVVLFAGTSLDRFAHPNADSPVTPCHWLLLDNGAMQVTRDGVVSKEVFGDHKVHIEFRTPFKPNARGQERGNSGVYLQGRYEVQVLDSYGLAGMDNECGGIYGVARPRINMCYPPLQWQTYEIEFRAPRFNAEGKKQEHARMTVWQNGVLIHKDVEVPDYTTAHIGGDMSEPGPLYLQDHGSPVLFRNIWILPR